LLTFYSNPGVTAGYEANASGEKYETATAAEPREDKNVHSPRVAKQATCAIKMSRKLVGETRCSINFSNAQ